MDNEAVRKLIQELIVVMDGSKLSELEVEVEGTRIRLQKESAKTKPEVVAVAAPAVNSPPAVAVPAAASAVPAPVSEPASEYKHVTAPMVGTFYAANAPDADPYVEVGDTVDEETVVCIIEAMKVMNEIKAEIQGKVVEVLVNDGEPVEYGQPLFLIDPSRSS
ncbi:MAG TPA: acetyl-CoA carboxylase biotin carboxyl carrier protein [Planctomycetota bacterium]|nr:acetyl-CoA carboxylase biotin carboxyl carrier protein [Planctomycetota bacterium]